MTISSKADIQLPSSQMREVQKRAKEAGQTVSEYLSVLIERDFLAEQTFDEMLRPVREDFQKSGVTAAQLEAIVKRARLSHAKKVRRNGR
jgi:hypothetical protein